MAIEKSLYAAPQGLEDLAAGEPDLQIEIENPDAVHIGIDGMEIDLEPHDQMDDEFNDNLAEYIDESVLQSLASELTADYDEDVSSRKDWMQTYVDGLELSLIHI